MWQVRLLAVWLQFPLLRAHFNLPSAARGHGLPVLFLISRSLQDHPEEVLPLPSLGAGVAKENTGAGFGGQSSL